MATLGQPLTSPESGWQRFDDNYGAIDYSASNLTLFSGGGYYQNTDHYSEVSGSWGNVSGTVKFTFYGSQIRLIGGALGAFGSHTVTIDGVTEPVYKLPSSTNTGQYLFYSKTGLTMGMHNVTINIVNDGQFGLDAIDVDIVGKIVYSNEQVDVSKMNIGDRIIAEYVSRSGGAHTGSFKNLGTSSANPIANGSSAPNGSFYFYYVGKDFRGRKILIADRNIQGNTSWDTLNQAGFATGSGIQMMFSSVPTMTSNTAPYGTVSASTFNTGNEPYKAFDGADDNSGWATTGGQLTGWLAYDFGTAKKISQYRMLSQNNGTLGTSRAPKNWTFEGSNDGTNWTVLDTRSNETSWISTVWKSFTVSNPSSFSQYRINVTANNGDASYLSIGEIEFCESPTNYNYATMRLLTGQNASDANGEWDKYIVNSTMNGTITAGDNSIWNWSGCYTWTSSTAPAGNTYRINRGNSSVAYFNYSASSATSALGFRPVLLVTEFTKRYLFQDGTNIKAYDSTNGWSIVGQAPATENMFLTSGMTDLSIVNNSAIQQLSSPTLLYYVQSTSVSSASTSLTGVPFVNYKYKVTSDNPSQMLIQDYGSNYINSTTNSFVTIPQSFFNSTNPYTITVTAMQDDSTTYTASGTVQLVDTKPSITASMSTGNTLNVTIDDPERDQVQYLIKLNGVQIYPSTTGYTSLSNVPYGYTRTFKSNEILIGQTNTIHIDAKDQYGLVASADLTFTGNYTGIMFSDDASSFYSTDLGSVLKYLDFGSIIASQTSTAMKVNIKNMNSFSIKNTTIWLQSTTPSGVTVEFSASNAPFIGSSTLFIPDVIASGNTVPFYVRIVTTKNATAGGTFDVYAKSSPS